MQSKSKTNSTETIEFTLLKGEINRVNITLTCILSCISTINEQVKKKIYLPKSHCPKISIYPAEMAYTTLGFALITCACTQIFHAASVFDFMSSNTIRAEMYAELQMRRDSRGGRRPFGRIITV